MITDVQLTDSRWLEFWANYRGLPHQKLAVALLRQHINQADPGLLSESAEWVGLWRQAEPKAAVVGAKQPNPLPVKWQSQLDNHSGSGYRECFSSSCGMLAMYWGKVPNDDAYNAIRAKHGDTTDAQAQLAALRSLGLKADFHTDGTATTLRREVDAERPVAVGWLHHGPVSAPSGGGHWSVVIGYVGEEAWVMNDPNGEANLVGGGYTPNTSGAGLRYSCKNWNPRWMPGGSGGWYLTCSPR